LRRNLTKYILILALFTMVLSFLMSCSGERDVGFTEQTPGEIQQPVPQEAAAGAQAVGQSEMWRVELLSAEMTQSLITTRAALQYGGGVLETTSEVLPAAGHSFLLMGFIIEKTGVGRAAFSWNDAHIVDSEGNVFFRHPNDTFLTHLNIPRLRAVDMVFGSEYGYVCFEIPYGAEGLRFVADNGNIVLDVTVDV